MKRSGSSETERKFTGFHMFLTICGFFAVVITANVTLAVFATGSWTGLVVDNSYVASQGFNETLDEAREQQELGWSSSLVYDDERISFRLQDADGNVVISDRVSALFKRPVHENEDQVVDLKPAVDGSYELNMDLADGVWDVEVTAEGPHTRSYRQIFRLNVSGGRAS